MAPWLSMLDHPWVWAVYELGTLMFTACMTYTCLRLAMAPPRPTPKLIEDAACAWEGAGGAGRAAGGRPRHAADGEPRPAARLPKGLLKKARSSARHAADEEPQPAARPPQGACGCEAPRPGPPSPGRPRELDTDVFLVDAVEACARAVDVLLREPEVAIDMEGVDLCRCGQICMIQVATLRDRIYLFDIAALGNAAFEQGRLRQLLESPDVCKVIFDGRADSDAMFYRHAVLMKPVYDLQVLHALCFSNPSDRFLKGLQRCMDDSGVVPPGEREGLRALKEEGKRLFSPRHGGAFEVWLRRPLPERLVQYAAADVRFLLAMRRLWGNLRLDVETLKLTTARITRTIGSPEPARGAHMAERDFPIPF